MSDRPTPEVLAALLEGRFGRSYTYLERTDSTQDAVRRLALEGVPEGAVVLAETQERGRGRQGRSWTGTPGRSLTFSLLLWPRLDPSRLPLLPLAGGLALCEACGVGGLKWPNDWLAPDGRKLAGVLLEAHFSGGALGYAVLGVGINVYPPVPDGAAALAEFGPVRRVEILARVLGRLEARYQQLYTDPEGVLSDYRSKSFTLGRKVSVRTPNGVVEGEALEVRPDGSLLVKNSAGLHPITAGDVQIVGVL
ncbi:MAG: biotin--[acetyl-CoA-carboxylase] ligase [Meiothermus sp.]